MPLTVDPQYVKAIEPFLSEFAKSPPQAVGEIFQRRDATDKLFDLVMPTWPKVENVKQTTYSVPIEEGRYNIPLTHFYRSDDALSRPGPVVFYIHGGGYFALSVKHYEKMLELYVSRSGVPIIAVDYRLAPDHPFPTPLDDCFAALEYISNNAKKLACDPTRIIVYGDSAGGGLAAALAIKARDEGFHPPIAKQMLVGPMLDDRTTAQNHDAVLQYATWTPDDNLTGWIAYLGDSSKVNSTNSGDVSAYAAPSRVINMEGLPPLYLEVPSLDIFLEESLEYARRIAAEKIETEIHVWKAVPHSFDILAPNIETATVALRCRVRAMQTI